MTRSLILFAHGARAASWAAPFERLRALVQARAPEVPVSLAFLELMEPRLPASMRAPKARQHRYSPVRLTSRIAFHSSSVKDSAGPILLMPTRSQRCA